MKKDDPLALFLPKKETGLDGFADDIDGKVDDAWHEAMKKYVPEILWNPDHPDRKTKTEKGGPGSGNWGHSGLVGVWGGSSPTKKSGFQPRTRPLDYELGEQFVADDAPKYTSPTKSLVTAGNVPLFDVDKYFDESRLEQLNNRYLKEYIQRVLKEDIDPEDFEKYRNSIEWVAKTVVGLEGVDPETGYAVVGDYEVEFTPSSEGYADYNLLFNGQILDEDGMEIGKSQIEIEVDEDYGEKKAYIHLLAFRDPVTRGGGGFGKRYMTHVEDVLFTLGVDYIELEADMSVGGYFWARAGYDFQDAGMLDLMIENLGMEWEYRYNEIIPRKIIDNIENSWDIAMTKGPDGEKIGKRVMLGSHWMGIKWNPDTFWSEENEDAYEIGKEYYEG